jgi:hypothetical protein
MGAQHSPRGSILATPDQTFEFQTHLAHFFGQFTDLVE